MLRKEKANGEKIKTVMLALSVLTTREMQRYMMIMTMF